MVPEDDSDDEEQSGPARPRSLSPALEGFMADWQPRQRRSAGYLAMLFGRVESLTRAHPEWEGYDLISHTLAGLHLIIENDRLTGGHTREQIADELSGLAADEQPGDDPARHREIASAVVDLLLNARDRHARMQQKYLRHAPGGTPEHSVLTLRLVRATGDDDTDSPVLRPTPEAINIFQNLFEFDPSDRAAAERYRSERMLQRRDYDEVLSSVDRRSTSVHGLRADLEGLMRRITYSVKDVDYAGEVIPRLEEALILVAEQVEAEEKFASAVAGHVHDDAPDLPRLQQITGRLQELIRSLSGLHRSASSVKEHYEQQQDRQLLTFRRMTISPQADLLEPMLCLTPGQLAEVAEGPLAAWMGVRPPRVPSLRALMDRMAPARRGEGAGPGPDPFNLGKARDPDEEFDPVLAAAVREILAAVDRPSSLSQLLSGLDQNPVLPVPLAARHRLLLPWALAVTVAGLYGAGPAGAEPAGDSQPAVTVVRTGTELCEDGTVTGDDLLIIPAAPGGGNIPEEE